MTANIGFGEWLELSCEYGNLLLSLIEMFILGFGVLWLPVIGLSLSIMLGISFVLALYCKYRQDLKTPPWYLVQMQEGEHAKTTDD